MRRLSNVCHNTPLGYYNPFGSIISEEISSEEFLDALAYFLHEDISKKGFFDFSNSSLKKPEERRDISKQLIKKYALALLTWAHERTHFYQISSSPLGLFIFGSTISKQATMQYLLLEMHKTEWIISGKNLLIPLGNWDRWLKKNNPGNSITEKVDLMVSTWNSINTYESTMFFNRITDVNDAIDDVTRLRLLIANTLKPYFDISQSQELPRIITRLEANLGCVPNRHCTTLSILESYATTVEMILLAFLNLPKEVNDEIIEDIVESGYLGGAEYVGYLYPNLDPRTLLAILDLALFTPIDPLFNGLWDDELYWEDIHPSFRVKQIATIANAKSMRVENSNFLDFGDSISQELNWPLPSRMLDRMSALHMVDRTFSKAKDLMPEEMRDGTKRSVAELYMFELLRKLAGVRANHQEFVENPMSVLYDYNQDIEPFITFRGDAMLLGNPLGIDKIELLGSCLKYNVVLDLFDNDSFAYTRRIVNRVTKDTSKIMKPYDLLKKLVEGHVFLPIERIKPL